MRDLNVVLEGFDFSKIVGDQSAIKSALIDSFSEDCKNKATACLEEKGDWLLEALAEYGLVELRRFFERIHEEHKLLFEARDNSGIFISRLSACMPM